jgi:hypothetical protein
MKILMLLAVLLLPSLASAAPLSEPARAFAHQTQFVQTAYDSTASKPFYSLDNLSIEFGASFRWFGPGAMRDLAPNGQPVVGIYNAWQLTEHVDAIGNVEYLTKTQDLGFTLGLRVVAKMPK